ncbi:hypothetical protein SteCoe_26729 [Stentor coeruleus]|uniref:Uncharacterized protein n=1 Tax=Stentor coeruleus TaxID=5963 RepID=A0A1R2BC69_9CILI|nr:hypothetical protein SteCoe_26729 [Stentor coeruleus]
MERRRIENPKAGLTIVYIKETESIHFTFITGTCLKYQIQNFIACSELISSMAYRNNRLLQLDLNDLGIKTCVPYLMMFIEYVARKYEYQLTTMSGIYFLRFCEIFKVKGDLAKMEEFILKIMNLRDIHENHTKIWTCKILTPGVMSKVVEFGLKSGSECLDVLRLYLDWIDEGIYSNDVDVQHSNAFLIIQSLLKVHNFYAYPFPNKKLILPQICSEYKCAYKVLDMQELFRNGWLS